MCGINGIIRPAGSLVGERELLRMRDALTHRGPDAAGHFFEANVGLGHRRLKIIDLSEAAAQPMISEDGLIVVVFNGEIYNFKSVRAELEARGHRFRSQSDTEIIVHGYEQWGERCVDKFNGMFAFAVYDKNCGEVFIARDRLGIKPLYYTRQPGAFLFASEIKAFIAFDGFAPQLNDTSLTEYLLFRSLGGEQTLFRGVKALLPGHSMRVRADLTFETHAYWDIDFSAEKLAGDFTEHQRRVLELLSESVALQEISDVPIGAQLSGGTDSSLVTALMAQGSKQPIKTFSVGFEEPNFNELPYARTVSRRLNTDHHEILLRHEEFANELARLTWQQDEPLTHANAAGVYWLCKQAKQHVTVLLTGEGADEMFAGYHRYERFRKIIKAQRWVTWSKHLLNIAPQRGRIRTLQVAATLSPLEIILQGTANGLASLAKHLDSSQCETVLERRADILARTQGGDWLTQALYYDLKTYLPPILMRQDKMSMAHGLETRVPFLDHRLVELAYQLPDSSKLQGGVGKRVIKQIATKYLPHEILFRTKIGFGLPLEQWMRSSKGLGVQLDQITEPSSLCARLLPKNTRETLVNEHRSGRASHTDALWTLLALETWHQIFFKPASTEALPVTLTSEPRC